MVIDRHFGPICQQAVVRFAYHWRKMCHVIKEL